MIKIHIHNGIADTSAGWARRLGISTTQFWNRINDGKTGDELFHYGKDKRREAQRKSVEEYVKANPGAERTCLSCNKTKKMHNFRPNGFSGGKRKFFHICKECEEPAKRWKKTSWQMYEMMEMERTRHLSIVLDASPPSHSLMPTLLEPYVTLRVFLDQ